MAVGEDVDSRYSIETMMFTRGKHNRFSTIPEYPSNFSYLSVTQNFPPNLSLSLTLLMFPTLQTRRCCSISFMRFIYISQVDELSASHFCVRIYTF